MLIDNPRTFLSSLFHAAVNASNPESNLAQHLPQKPKGRTVVVGCGKSAAQMARALELHWDELLEGFVVTGYGYGCETSRIKVLEASHPIPDGAGLQASRKILDSVSSLTTDDLVIALISGGGSALLPCPPQGFDLRDEIILNEALLTGGVPISEMNTIRKHFSEIKGGKLAIATQARVATLIISDIPGDNPAHTASGPTIADDSNRDDAIEIIKRYGLNLPRSIVEHIASAESIAPCPDDPRLVDNSHRIIASARLSLDAAANEARSQGIDAVILSDAIEGEARDVASVHAAIAREICRYDRPFTRPIVLLSGGETTVTLREKVGRGGRNGEFALAAALSIQGLDVDILSADTDGIDGSENNAGAFANGQTVHRLRDAGINGKELLSDHDSYSGFLKLNDLFETGPTGINVNDFRAILIR